MGVGEVWGGGGGLRRWGEVEGVTKEVEEEMGGGGSVGCEGGRRREGRGRGGKRRGREEGKK